MKTNIRFFFRVVVTLATVACGETKSSDEARTPKVSVRDPNSMDIVVNYPFGRCNDAEELRYVYGDPQWRNDFQWSHKVQGRRIQNSNIVFKFVVDRTLVCQNDGLYLDVISRFSCQPRRSPMSEHARQIDEKIFGGGQRSIDDSDEREETHSIIYIDGKRLPSLTVSRRHAYTYNGDPFARGGDQKQQRLMHLSPQDLGCSIEEASAGYFAFEVTCKHKPCDPYARSLNPQGDFGVLSQERSYAAGGGRGGARWLLIENKNGVCEDGMAIFASRKWCEMSGCSSDFPADGMELRPLRLRSTASWEDKWSDRYDGSTDPPLKGVMQQVEKHCCPTKIREGRNSMGPDDPGNALVFTPASLGCN